MRSPIELVNRVAQLANKMAADMLADYPTINVQHTIRGKKYDVVRPGILLMLDTPQSGERSIFGALMDWELTVFSFPEENADAMLEAIAGIEMLQAAHSVIREFSREIRFDPNAENISVIEVTTGKTKLASNYVISFPLF